LAFGPPPAAPKWENVQKSNTFSISGKLHAIIDDMAASGAEMLEVTGARKIHPFG